MATSPTSISGHPRESRRVMPLQPTEIAWTIAAVVLAGILGAIVNVRRRRG